MLTKSLVAFMLAGALAAPGYAAPLALEDNADGVTVLANKGKGHGKGNGNGNGRGNGGGKSWGSCK
jgi:hypothetical protein